MRSITHRKGRANANADSFSQISQTLYSRQVLHTGEKGGNVKEKSKNDLKILDIHSDLRTF